ncbi:MAG TPA: MauE/DoxX family redox-associated membrane protein [Tepidisphaeraceae bacterium]|jgi:hypothetical protein|nr:MauE/DoxX family redox-associated membrane protein [Tepidisphaeraceae bacterium]
MTGEAKTNPLSRVDRSRLPYVLVRDIFAIVLLISAALKAQDLLRPPVLSVPSIWNQVLTWVEIGVEWSVAAWLLTEIAPRWARRTAMTLLAIFIGISGWRLFGGQSNCGCFGAVHVHPKWTLAFDIAALALIYGFGRATLNNAPPREILDHDRSFRLHRMTFGVLLSIIVPGAILEAWPATAGQQVDHVVVIDVKTLQGKLFPLLDFMDDASRSDLMKGQRIVILFNHDCDACREYLSHRAQTAKPSEVGEIYDIDLSPLDAGDTDAFPSSFKRVRLQQGILCSCPTPLELSLHDGVVESVEEK